MGCLRLSSSSSSSSRAKTDFYTKWHVYADYYTRIILENNPLLQKSAYRSHS